jgi:DNA-binding transcriptional regulator GbsR (MarR family)
VTTLSDAKQKFILHWGEMGARWGINRTVAQIHALLYLSPEPLTAEEIATTLSVARSNVSTSLKTLQSWELINIVHVLGDRRDRFESMKDVWELIKVVIENRKRREVDPTLAMLRECLEEVGTSEEPDSYTRQRLEEMLEFFETTMSLYDHLHGMPKEQVLQLVKMGSKLQRLLGILG